MNATPTAGRAHHLSVALVVIAACAVELMVMGRAVSPLVAALLISYLLWLGQPVLQPTRAVIGTYVAAVLVQCAHVVEEYATGFYAVFPPILGSAPWSPMRFLAFNLVWVAIFVLTGIGIVRSYRPAYMVALFLALGGGIANGLGHLGLTARRGAYFPGVYTGVVALFAGSTLLRKLLRPERTNVIT